MWVGHSVAAVKLPQAVLPAAYITPTLFSATPRPIRSFFVWTPIASYGAIQQKESWTLMVSYGAERVNITSNML